MSDTMQQRAINQARGLAIDQVEKANSGHPGLPLGSSPMLFELMAKHMKFNPANPYWADRDRFVLSAGHASAMLYSMGYLFGYGYTIEDLKGFRQFGTHTPGHPDYDLARGVEMTTGPLGQGVATAVGMALGERRLAALFNTDEHEIFDHYTYALVGDGCLMEGVSAEASSFAGHLGLGRLIVLYDSNNITIEGNTEIAFTENVGQRYQAYGWDYHFVENGNDVEAVAAAIEAAKKVTDKPSLIEVKTNIGYMSPVQDSEKAHGSPLGAEGVRVTKERLGLDPDKHFHVDDDVLAYCRSAKDSCKATEQAWLEVVEAYIASSGDKGRQLQDYLDGKSVDLASLPGFADFDKAMATRETSGVCLNRWSVADPLLIGGSADLASSTKTEVKDSGWIARGDFAAKNIHYGVREHGMGAIANGLALMGLHSYCATFMVFTDYMRYSIRMAALMKLPTLFVMTHDSIGVGEDGETHQPIEHYASLRIIPHLWFWRPADGRETAAAYSTWHREGPTVLSLSRQKLALLENSSVEDARKGGYVLAEANVSDNKPAIILLASGSETEIAFGAYKTLADEGVSVRVVSMPCMEAFEAQSAEYKESVLPKAVKKRLSIEAGSTISWRFYVGEEGYCLGLDHFGASGPASVLYQEYGLTAANAARIAKELLAQ
ncbi:MAG: transketolase [Clostridia bacterium]|nr:transketolase [Clostridia bacterium]